VGAIKIGQSRYTDNIGDKTHSDEQDINFMNTIHVHGSVYAIQQYVTKYVSDLWHVDGPLQVLRFALPTKMTSEI
jgi:hypothetical protein